MKKILTLLAMFVGVVCFASARDIYAHDASVLPAAAQTTLKNNCKAGVSVVKIDKDFGRISEYEVVLTDGTEVTFDHNGNWKDVEVGIKSSVPKGFIPAAIANYIAKNQPKVRVIGIEKSSRGYEVDLSNGVEMKFDAAGNFLRFDK